MHDPPPLNVPLSLEKLTVPVGVVAPLPDVSVTVAVHVAVVFTAIVAGAQEIVLLVDLVVAVTIVLPLLAA